MSAGGAGFRASRVRWSVFRRRRGTSPSPTLGRRRCRRRRGMSAGGAGVPVLPRPVVGVSPAAGDEPQPYIRTVVIVSPAVQGSGPPRSVVGVSLAAGDKPQPYRGRRCRRRYIRTVVIVSLAVGDECRRCRVPALPRPVVGVSPAAGDKPQPYRGRRCRRRRGTSAGVTLGRRCRRPVGDECRRCRVPALPRPVVGVSLAAGDKPQPYIRSAALPPAGWGRAPAVQGSRPPTSGGRCFAGGGGQAPALH